MTVQVDSEEFLSVSRTQGKALAEATELHSDPFPHLPPSLLSAEHIKLYVKKTGLISPFFEGGDKRSRLKKASYEGRLGRVAYEFIEGKLVKRDINASLRVPANSILFVECDLDFRLPEYIALRFNLQIKHVHRGLLLGTGPLVDPGFWGKLCIPLHNLTSEDYLISREEGLIWVEFTKTTSALTPDIKAIGRRPSTSNNWDIRALILKAANSNGTDYSVPIQSSIPAMFSGASNKAAEAEESAKSSAAEVRKITNFAYLGGAAAVIATLLGVAQLVSGQNSFVVSQHTLYRDYIESAHQVLESVNTAQEKWTKSVSEADTTLPSQESKMLNERLRLVEAENARLKRRVDQLVDHLTQMNGKSLTAPN